MLEKLNASMTSAAGALGLLRAQVVVADFEEIQRLRSFCADLIRTLALRQTIVPASIRRLCKSHDRESWQALIETTRDLSIEVTRLFKLLSREDGNFTLDAQTTYRQLVIGFASRERILDELSKVGFPLSDAVIVELLKTADLYEELISSVRLCEEDIAKYLQVARDRLNSQLDSIDITPALIAELGRLVTEASNSASATESDAAKESLKKAEAAAKAGDKRTMAAHLRSAGKWAWDFATKVGVSVAADVIKKSML